MKDFKQRQLAKIHIAKKALGMDDDTYRAVLRKVGGVDSSKSLTPMGRADVIKYMTDNGWEDQHP